LHSARKWIINWR